jgi:hypothetical protein
MRGSPRFADRIRLLREVLLPSQVYLLARYGLRGKPLTAWLLRSSTSTAARAARGRFSRGKSEIMTAYTWQP